ncbi:MAG: threonine/serine exporter family protein [Bacteroidaceae bacterium]
MNILLEFFLDGLFAAIAGIGFGAISNPPRRAFPYIAILAASGHMLRHYLMSFVGMDIAFSSLFAGILIGLLSMPLAYRAATPSTVIYIPALLPMIPGKFAYNTLFSVMMFLRHSHNPDLADLYLNKFLSNGLITFSVIFFLTIGSTMPVFILPRKAYQMTRKNKVL